ncbi:MAG: hypothetical protein L6428_09825 [Candidatus Aminicenantes bacterium]|nr:hypothetical protein [Acidobacteriota bacterium]MCG2811742.1 hypothetical protein [Candidatus Aminicenantes bacterium]
MIETKVVISVSGGNVNGIFTNSSKTKVYLVDYDNLEADPSDDCSQVLPARKIEEFQALAAKEKRSFPSIAELAVRLKE